MTWEQSADEHGGVAAGRSPTRVSTRAGEGWFYHVTAPERARSILEEGFDPDTASAVRRRFDERRTERRYREVEARTVAADAFERTRRQVFPAAPGRADSTALWPTRRALDSHLALYDRDLQTVRVRSRGLFDAGPVLVADFRLAAVARQAAEQAVDDPGSDHDLTAVTRRYWESAEVCHSPAEAARVAAAHDWPEALVPGHVPRDLIEGVPATEDEPTAARPSAVAGSPAHNP